MIAIMTRELSDNLASLVKELDKKVEEHKDRKLVLAVVLLTDDEEFSKLALSEFEEQHALVNTALTLFPDPAGPKNYHIAAEAEITVMMWVKKTVKANHAFESAAALDAAAATIVVKDTALILE